MDKSLRVRIVPMTADHLDQAGSKGSQHHTATAETHQQQTGYKPGSIREPFQYCTDIAIVSQTYAGAAQYAIGNIQTSHSMYG